MAQTDSNTSKNKFKHLLFHQRTLIEFMVKNGYKPADIARVTTQSMVLEETYRY